MQAPYKKISERGNSRLLTLWNIMQRFYPEFFLQFVAISESIAGPPKVPGISTNAMVLSDAVKASGITALIGTKNGCMALGLRTSVITIDKLITLLSKAEPTFGEQSELLRELQGRITDEMRGEFFFWLTSQEVERYDNWEKGWEIILKRFPDTTRDVEEMNKCFALGRYTASMFHALHVAEWGAIKLGDYIGATDPKKSWSATSRKLAELMKGGHSNLPANLGGKFEFLEQMNREVESMVLAWRHKVDHAANHLAIVPNTDFTPDVAEHIIGAVRIFMLRLTEGIP
jgi:hypothetical protein